MFNFKAKFLLAADDATEPGTSELNGFTVMSLDSFLKSGSVRTAAGDKKKDKDDKGKAKKNDKAKKEDKKKDEKPKKEEPKKDDTSKKEPLKSDPNFGLGAPVRRIPDDEMQAYLKRIHDKKKDPQDKYNMPYVHHSNIKIVDGNGKEFDLAALRAKITKRPSSLLKQNEKMQHSDGTATQYYNVGLPALRGLAVNEKTGEFVVADTCPGSGSCKTFCYAMRGSYVMFKDTSMMQTQTLNYLLNNPEKFKARLKAEIGVAIADNEDDDTQVAVRWHDAGDFFSPQYMDLAYDVARAYPDVQFYAYTKMASVANSDKPSNFIINFSEGAHPSQTKQVDLTKIKQSVVVPIDMFGDLLVMLRNGRPFKGENGQAQFKDAKAWDEFKKRVAEKYKLDPKTILHYNEYMDKKRKGELGDKQLYWNVIVPPGGGDNASNDNLVQGSYLMFH